MTPTPTPWELASPRDQRRGSGEGLEQYVLNEEEHLCFTCPLDKCRPYSEKKCPIKIRRRAVSAFEREDTAAFVRLAGRLRKTRERFMVGA